MPDLWSVFLMWWRNLADVAAPQGKSEPSIDWSFGQTSVTVPAGRTQAAFLSKRWMWGGTPHAVQEYWSRGCLRAHVSYLVFACWRLLPPAHQKKKLSPMWKSRFQPNLPTQVNTSDLKRRVDRGTPRQRAALSGREARSLRLTTDLGLFVLCPAMLKTDAVPNVQDRSLC